MQTPMRGNSDAADDVTKWVRSMESGDEQAATQLWQYCFPRLLKYSRKKLPDHLRRVLDEEDVALSAFKSFCMGAAQGSLGDIQSRDELWRLLYCITARKAQGYIRHQTRKKRGGGKVAGESIFGVEADVEQQAGLEQVADPAASPAMMAQFASDCERLFDMLDDEVLQTIALLRIEGYSVDEIADRVGCAKRSVERRLNLIRRIWRAADSAQEAEATQGPGSE